MPRELPIFPLPLVLFPDARQALHIFEPRYRQMLADCLAGDSRFGIAYVPVPTAGDVEAVPSPGDVGCVAVIRATHQLPDGRSDILTDGERRFRLLQWCRDDRLYRLARVEEFEDDAVAPGEAATLAADVRYAFQRLTVALGRLAGNDFEEPIDLRPILPRCRSTWRPPSSSRHRPSRRCSPRGAPPPACVTWRGCWSR